MLFCLWYLNCCRYSTNDIKLNSYCVFDGNMAILDGGAIMINSESRILDSYSTYSYNAALKGGAIYINTNNHNCSISNGVFAFNLAYGGKFKENISFYEDRSDDNSYYDVDGLYSTTNSDIDRRQIHMYGGGAIYLSYNNILNRFQYCIFENNIAPNGVGGAVASYATNNGIAMVSNEFKDNSASQGGAIGIFSYHGHVLVAECNFFNNSAINGGAIASLLYNVVYIENSIVSSNNASHMGGGVYCNTHNYAIHIIQSVVVNNTADQGAGLYFGPDHEVVKIVETAIEGNTVLTDGGGIYCDVRVAITIESSALIANTAGYRGGGLYLPDHILQVKNCAVSNNAALIGGGLYIVNAQHCDVTSTMFVNNHGTTGASVWISASSNVVIANNRFERNVAGFVCGGVYWEHSDRKSVV